MSSPFGADPATDLNIFFNPKPSFSSENSLSSVIFILIFLVIELSLAQRQSHSSIVSPHIGQSSQSGKSSGPWTHL